MRVPPDAAKFMPSSMENTAEQVRESKGTVEIRPVLEIPGLAAE